MSKRCDDCGGWKWYYYNEVNQDYRGEFVVCTTCGKMTPFDKDKITMLSFFHE